MGLMPPRSGRSGGAVTFQGRDLLALSKKEKREVWGGKQIAMVFQDPGGRSLNPVVRVERQLTEGMRKHLGIGSSEARGGHSTS